MRCCGLEKEDINEKSSDYTGTVHRTDKISFAGSRRRAGKIQAALNEKLDALVKYEIYTKYKMADTEEERRAARKEYLDKIGLQADFRW